MAAGFHFHNKKNVSVMKHNKHNNGSRAAGPDLVPVRFEFTHPTAAAVSVAGCFNHWQPEAKTLHSTGGGHWLKETALKPGDYEYCLVVDGVWMPDPAAKESVPNPYGGRNSILRVTGLPEAKHLADAQHLPLHNNYKRNAQTP